MKLWEIPAEKILHTGLLGLLPLLPLTKDGKRHDLIEEMIIELAFHEKYELLLQAKTIARLVFQGATEHEWIERKFAVYKDIIEESWVYQEIIKKGKLEALHQGVLNLIQERFPEIAQYAKKPVEGITDVEVLLHLIIKVGTVQTSDEALQVLLALNTDSKKN
jgi:hypothetical protein